MFSTKDGAKEFAEMLRLALHARGYNRTQSECRSFVARACLFDEWSELIFYLKRKKRKPVKREVFLEELLGFMPVNAQNDIEKWYNERFPRHGDSV